MATVNTFQPNNSASRTQLAKKRLLPIPFSPSITNIHAPEDVYSIALCLSKFPKAACAVKNWNFSFHPAVQKRNQLWCIEFIKLTRSNSSAASRKQVRTDSSSVFLPSMGNSYLRLMCVSSLLICRISFVKYCRRVNLSVLPIRSYVFINVPNIWYSFQILSFLQLEIVRR